MRALLSLASLALATATWPAAAQGTSQAPASTAGRPKYVVSYLLHLETEPSRAGSMQQPWLTVVLSESPTQLVNPESYIVLRYPEAGAVDLSPVQRSGAVDYTTAATTLVELMRDAALGGRPVYASGRTAWIQSSQGRRQVRILQNVLVSTLIPQITFQRPLQQQRPNVKPLPPQPQPRPKLKPLPPQQPKLKPLPSQPPDRIPRDEAW